MFITISVFFSIGLLHTCALSESHLLSSGGRVGWGWVGVGGGGWGGVGVGVGVRVSEPRWGRQNTGCL